jgi:AraC-like DNA-binding protein/quercetin dioxygenase-like cupin family protein
MKPPATSHVISLCMDDGAQVEAMFAGDPKAHFDLHWHAEWSVGAILEGRCEFTCAGERQVAEAGDLVLMAPCMLHTAGVSAQGFRMVMLYVPHAWVAAHLGWPVAQRGELRRGVWKDDFTARALAQAALSEDGGEVGRLLAQVLRAQTGDALVAVERQMVDARVEAVCQALATEDACRIDPGALARIGRAKVLLREGQAAAEVAVQCGFTDQAHFSRWFRRCFGVTPGNYRAVRRGAESAV